MNPFFIVEEFERQVAEFADSRFAVAVATGTWALFLALKCVRTTGIYPGGPITLPARTFISVPASCLQAGVDVVFEDYEWKGVYKLSPYDITDGALRFRRNMYEGGLHCLSFHYRKHLPIGEGGMILTDDREQAQWLKAARYCGRRAPDYSVEDVSMIGWQAYMSVEKAARGLAHMQWVRDDLPDQEVNYPDLRKVPYFAKRIHSSIDAESQLA